MLTLYYAPHTCALATHIVMEEVGADHSTVRIDFARKQQRSADYLKVNPKGRVPALVIDHGILTETPAMLVFVAQRFPEARLAPMEDAFLFAQIQSFNAYLCSHLHVAHAHRMRGYRWVDADDAHSIAAMQRYTICDPYLFTLAQWLEADGVDPNRIPRVVEHRQRVAQRAATKKAIAQELA